MTEEIKQLVLYTRKSKDGQAASPVTVGSLGPFVLARISDGEIVNGFGLHDIPKPVRLSAETLRQLSEIFFGKRAKAS
jgi:hypothetical protein